MEKYWAVFSITWQQGLVYRLNFILWRVRSVLQLLLVYFIWWTVFQTQQQVFGYTQSSILTYVIVVSLIRAIVLSSRVMDIVDQINSGGIVNFLLKPLNLLVYYFSRDIADKLLNISFVIVEILLIFVLLNPTIIIQTNPVTLSLFVLAIFLGLVLYFNLNFMFGLLSFWLENMWGVFFLFFMIIEAFGGGLFPIDIMPEVIKNFLLLTPFPYLLYFPAKIFLGSLTNQEIIMGFFVLIFWLIASSWLLLKTLNAGLRTYTAIGH